MFCLAAFLPSPPILVPGLGGALTRADAPGDPTAALRAAARAVAAELAAEATEWTVLGVGPVARTVDPGSVGTFRGYGVDVPVALSGPPRSRAATAHAAGVAVAPDPGMDLAALIAGWLREQVEEEIRARVRVLAADTPGAVSARIGSDLRAELDASADRHAVLIVGDGAATLTEKSPGYLDVRAVAHQDRLDAALTTGDRAGLGALDDRLCAELAVAGRPVFQALSGLFAVDALAPAARTLYRDAPFGVGYHVGVWRPGGRG